MERRTLQSVTLDLAALARRDYEHAFTYVTQLTDPALDENRDVLLFPEQLMVNGRRQYVCIHRPFYPKVYPFVKEDLLPSIFICASDDLGTLWKESATQTILASPKFEWESNRIGASAPVMRISSDEWLLSYHGRNESGLGYTQSFMILQEQPNALPRVKHRCSDRIMFAQEPFEMPNKSPRPCVFVTGLIKLDDKLMVAYGASDERVGIGEIDYDALLARVRAFDEQGNRKGA